MHAVEMRKPVCMLSVYETLHTCYCCVNHSMAMFAFILPCSHATHHLLVLFLLGQLRVLLDSNAAEHIAMPAQHFCSPFDWNSSCRAADLLSAINSPSPALLVLTTVLVSSCIWFLQITLFNVNPCSAPELRLVPLCLCCLGAGAAVLSTVSSLSSVYKKPTGCLWSRK